VCIFRSPVVCICHNMMCFTVGIFQVKKFTFLTVWSLFASCNFHSWLPVCSVNQLYIQRGALAFSVEAAHVPFTNCLFSCKLQIWPQPEP
jgi:hypothetical protein